MNKSLAKTLYFALIACVFFLIGGIDQIQKYYLSENYEQMGFNIPQNIVIVIFFLAVFFIWRTYVNAKKYTTTNTAWKKKMMDPKVHLLF